jgi:hypothetical protein
MYIAEESASDIVSRIRTAIMNLIKKLKRWIKQLFRKADDNKDKEDLKKAYTKMDKAESEVKDCNDPQTLKKFEEEAKKQEEELAKAQKEMEEKRDEFMKNSRERHDQMNKALKEAMDEINKPFSWDTENVESPNKKAFDEIDEMLDKL